MAQTYGPIVPLELVLQQHSMLYGSYKAQPAILWCVYQRPAEQPQSW